MTPAAHLPEGSAPAPVALPHFPSRLHAFVWRNWELVSLDRMARVLGCLEDEVRELGRGMGLRGPAPLPEEHRVRVYLTVIRRNWHLLPYDQLLELLGWTAEELAYALQEDDFLWVKLGRLKPRCEPLRYQAPDESARTRAAEIASIVSEAFGADRSPGREALFEFVSQLSAPPPEEAPRESGTRSTAPRICYSYFAPYGDPLLGDAADPYPDGYLQRLACSGVNGVWLQGVLYRLAPFPWDPGVSDRWEERLKNLRALVERAGRQGIGLYLYLNEPRSMPVSFYEARPELRGVTAAEHATLCTSVPEVREYLASAVERVCRAAPGLAGFITITASENLTSCWSHHRGAECPRCGPRGAAAVVAEVIRTFQEGIRRAGGTQRLHAWDWGWKDEDAAEIIRGLPEEAVLQSTSEWCLPINRGGVETEVGEYSISAVGPGPRARRHWELARERGLRTAAKIQAGNTWELSAVPYIPALENVARHVANLAGEGVEALMLGWTLGGYPSPNLEISNIKYQISNIKLDVDGALGEVARQRYGDVLGPAVVRAWKAWSAAFGEFPYYGGVVYNAPLQVGPANLLWEAPTGYRSTMVGFPYDDLTGWRAVYPGEVFAAQLERVSAGFEAGVDELRGALTAAGTDGSVPGVAAVRDELRVAEAAAIHWRSAANQARFVLARDALAETKGPERDGLLGDLERILRDEMELARRLYALQREDSRLGFEASNQYYYVPADLVEKVLNCRDLLDRWLPCQLEGVG